MKRCNKCGELKDEAEYRLVKRTRKGNVTYEALLYCKDCEHKQFKEANARRMSDPNYAEYRKSKVTEHCKKYQQSDKYELRLREGRERNATKPKSCKIYLRTCEITGELFVARKPWARMKPDIRREYRLERSREYGRERDYGNGKGLRNCNWCNKEYDFLIEGTPKFCSKECKRKAYRQQQNILHTKRRVIQKTRRVQSRFNPDWCENINPIKVFNRDHWTCQLCGCKTPKKLRGTFAPNAPEVDHIIPLAKGGLHTYSNVQCLCKKCNQGKSDKLIGQLKLVI